jgi:hypothetical protein
MNDYGGYLFVVDEPQRAGSIKRHIKTKETFTDSISAPDWEPKQVEIFLICLEQTALHYAALVQRGRRVVTDKHLIRFSNFVEFEPAILLQDIQQKLQPQIKRYFMRASTGIGERITPKTWQGLLQAIKELRPDSSKALDRLVYLRQPPLGFFEKPGFHTVAAEKDAVNIALRMAGFAHHEILDWHTPDDKPAPFLQGLSNAELIEDQIIEQDTKVFGDWKFLKPLNVGAVAFEKNGERLTIMNVNRNKVEHNLGVDLFYYHHRYGSYVMIQYKRMKKEKGEFGYRPNDTSYHKEFQRMQAVEEAIAQQNIAAAPSDLNGYRLHSGLFYFKICPSEVFDPTSGEMSRGLYIPLDYWKTLVNSPEIVGPQGGKRITFKNIGRNFSNTLFVNLAQEGWIGSGIQDEAIVSDIIRQALQGKKSVLLAAVNKIAEQP